jgi:hypothetical protein
MYSLLLRYQEPENRLIPRDQADTGLNVHTTSAFHYGSALLRIHCVQGHLLID